MVWGAAGLAICFAVLTIFGGIAQDLPSVPELAVEIPGSVTLFVATAIFGIGWLATVWLIPTEIYPSTARAQGGAISVIIWGLANFAITLLTPIGFNNLKYWCSWCLRRRTRLLVGGRGSIPLRAEDEVSRRTRNFLIVQGRMEVGVLRRLMQGNLRRSQGRMMMRSRMASRHRY